MYVHIVNYMSTQWVKRYITDLEIAKKKHTDEDTYGHIGLHLSYRLTHLPGDIDDKIIMSISVAALASYREAMWKENCPSIGYARLNVVHNGNGLMLGEHLRRCPNIKPSLVNIHLMLSVAPVSQKSAEHKL